MAALDANIARQKLAILDEYLVDHCWMVTCDHYLDGLL